MKTPSYFGESGKISPISTMSCSILAVVSLLEKADLRRCISRLFGEIPKKIIEIGAKFDENCGKIRVFAEVRAKMRKKFDDILPKY